MGSRVYIGNLPTRANERDLEHFFRGFGRIRDVMLKNGFGFVEFDDNRDAEDAVYEQNGREMMGHRVVVELSRRRFGYGRRDGGGGFRDGGGVMTSDGRVNGRFPPPMKTRYRMVITNLSSRCNWQEIKDMMRMDGKVNVTYADAHKRARNEALLCFASHEDLKRAMDKFQGKDINGRRIKIVDDSEVSSGGGRRRSRSRSDSRSRSRSARRSRSRSRSARRSRSRSPPSRSRSRSASSKGSRAKNGDGNASGDEKEKQRRSRSRSAASSAASSNKSGGGGGRRSRSGTPADDGSPRNNGGDEEGKKMDDE